jgi:hypothetical protein
MLALLMSAEVWRKTRFRLLAVQETCPEGYGFL